MYSSPARRCAATSTQRSPGRYGLFVRPDNKPRRAATSGGASLYIMNEPAGEEQQAAWESEVQD